MRLKHQVARPQIQAGADVQAVLSSVPFQEDTLSYQINIGIDANSK